MYADKLRILLIIVLAALASPLFAQKSKAQLQKEKQDNLLKIQEAEKILYGDQAVSLR